MILFYAAECPDFKGRQERYMEAEVVVAEPLEAPLAGLRIHSMPGKLAPQWTPYQTAKFFSISNPLTGSFYRTSSDILKETPVH